MADLCERQRTKLPAPRPPTMGGLLPVIPLPNICLVQCTTCHACGTQTGGTKTALFPAGLGHYRLAFFAAASQDQAELAAEGAALRPPPFGISAAD